MQYYVNGEQKRLSLSTRNYQLAKAKLAKFQNAESAGEENPLPTKTRIAEVVQKYAEYIRVRKTEKSAQTDIYYLRSAFGAICPALEVNSRKQSVRQQKRPAKFPKGVKLQTIQANYFEDITSRNVSEYISSQVRAKGLAPKTANRYREILCRLFNWAMNEGGVNMPGNKNPAAQVERYKEKAPQIRFLTLPQINEQLNALENYPTLQAMVAVYIYAGLRREEALWLQREDIDLKAGRFGMIRIRAKTIGERYWQPKTAANRAVPISSTLRAYLERYSPKLCENAWYFSSPKGYQYDPDNFSRDLRNAQRLAGLKWSCLDFRHTFGSQLAQKGESLYKISTLMGNSPEICRRHYAALIPEALGECVEFETDNPTLRLSAS